MKNSENILNISNELWIECGNNFENSNYFGAINDSIYCLSEIIRLKSGLDLDGAALINSALSPKSPIIKLNIGESESDKSIQEGYYFLLRGVYAAIRNPRFHKKHNDERKEAEAIIKFIDYLIMNLNTAQSKNSVYELKKKVFDKAFVKDNEYIDLIIDDIPQNKRYELFLELLNDLNHYHVEQVGTFQNVLLSRLTEGEKELAIKIISDLLKSEVNYKMIKLFILIIKDDWQIVEKVSKIRIEELLIQNLFEGETYYDSYNEEGKMGIYINYILKNSIRSEKIISRFNSHILNSRTLERDQFICDELLPIYLKIEKIFSSDLIQILKSKISNSENIFINYLESLDDELKNIFKDELEEFYDVPF